MHSVGLWELPSTHFWALPAKGAGSFFPPYALVEVMNDFWSQVGH